MRARTRVRAWARPMPMWWKRLLYRMVMTPLSSMQN